MTQTYKLRGDWMRDGYIENLGMPKRLTITIVNGRAYAVDMDGCPETRDPPLTIDEDGAIKHEGARSPIFQPDDSEIDRVGRQFFTSPT